MIVQDKEHTLLIVILIKPSQKLDLKEGKIHVLICCAQKSVQKYNTFSNQTNHST